MSRALLYIIYRLRDELHLPLLHADAPRKANSHDAASAAEGKRIGGKKISGKFRRFSKRLFSSCDSTGAIHG